VTWLEQADFMRSTGAAYQTKAVSPESAAWMAGQDVDANGGGAQMVSPYSQSSWVYIAVSRIAEKVSSIPFRISRMDDTKARRVRALRSSADPKHRAFCKRALGETIIESGDVVDLFNRPHPMMNRQLFWEMVVTWNCLRGEFFLLPLDNGDNVVDLATSAPRINRLLTLPTDLFWHVVTGYELSGWRYTGSPLASPIPSEFLLPSEVIHSRMPNPYLFWRGMSPLVVAMGAAGADFAASKYNQGYWLNNADTGLIVTSDAWPTKEQREAILAALRERKRKAGTPDRPMFLGGGTKVEKPTLSGMEQQFVENRKMNRQEIGAIYKVSDAIMGFSVSGALSGGDARKSEEIAFIENTIQPTCEHLEAAVEPVVKSFGPGLMGWFDVESLPVMQEARRTRLDSGVKAFGIGYTRNEVNAVYDLGFPEDKTGNKRYLPFGLQEVGTEESLPGEDVIDAEVVDDEAKSNPFARLGRTISALRLCDSVANSQQRAPDTKVLWQAHIATRRKMVKLMQGKVGKVLNEFRGQTLAKLGQIPDFKKWEAELLVKMVCHSSNEIRAHVLRSLVDLIFSPSEFGKQLVAQLSNPITATLQLAGDELHKELGIDDPWQMPPQKALDYLAGRTQPVQDCGYTVRDQLNTALQAGLDAGEGTDELAQRVKGVFNELADFEARRIAQTETNMAYNDARHVAMEDAGIGYKAWLSSHGPNVRPAHAAAEQATIDNPIPLDQPFDVGGDQMMYPGDDSLGADISNIINCQCIQLAAQKVSEDAKSITFKLAGLGVMKFIKP
jgi:HK97 family phage portal protein